MSSRRCREYLPRPWAPTPAARACGSGRRQPKEGAGMTTGFTHLNEHGLPRLVDVGSKEETEREAVARGCVRTTPAVVAAIREGRIEKGAVLPVAQVAGIMGAKRTAEWI